MTRAVPTAVEVARAMEEIDNSESAFFTKVEGDSATLSEMVHEVFEINEENIKDAAPTDCCSTAVDQKDKSSLRWQKR